MSKREMIKALIQMYNKSRYWIDFIKNTIDMSGRLTEKELEARFNICEKLYKEREEQF